MSTLEDIFGEYVSLVLTHGYSRTVCSNLPTFLCGVFFFVGSTSLLLLYYLHNYYYNNCIIILKVYHTKHRNVCFV